MVANLPRHSATLQGHTTELHTFNKQELILQTRINHPHWQVNVMVTERLWKVGGKISFLCLINLSGPSLKTKKRNILECWRRSKKLSFFTLDLSRDTSPTYASGINAVLLARVAQ